MQRNDMEDAEMIAKELEGEYLKVRVLPDGSIAATGDLLTTRAVYLGMSRLGWTKRFCFADRELASKRLDELVSEDDAPEGWIASRPERPCDN